MDLVENIEVN